MGKRLHDQGKLRVTGLPGFGGFYTRTGRVRRVITLCYAKANILVTWYLVTIAGRRVTKSYQNKYGQLVLVTLWFELRVINRNLHTTATSHIRHGFTCFWFLARVLLRRSHTRGRKLGNMARDPLQLDRDSTDRSSEFGFGAGMFPDPRFDFSGGGSISRIPIADPDRHEQLLQLAMIKRTDVNDPTDAPSPYVLGNTDRFGAAPPLVRERNLPPYKRQKPTPPRRMQRQW